MTIKKWSEDTILRFQKEGRGSGFGADYMPWIEYKDFSSRGKTRRVLGIKVPRMHHFLSESEYRFFVCAEWDSRVVDIREQYPLDRDRTREIADELKIAHPCYPGTAVATVMTVDFYLTLEGDDGDLRNLAVNVKTDDAVEDARELDKLEIQRTYFDKLDIEHHLVFDSTIPDAIYRNLNLIRGLLTREAEDAAEVEELLAAKFSLEGWIRTIDGRHRNKSAATLCTIFDETFGKPSGTGLRALATLIYERTVPVNLRVERLFDISWDELTNVRSEPGGYQRAA